MLQLIGSTQSDFAKKEGVTEEILQNIMDCHKMEKVDWKSIKRIGLLGVDEIAQKKGYRDYVTLMTSHHQGKNKILGVIEGKEKASIEAFLLSIPKKKKKTITAVCVDMCNNYIGAVVSVFNNDVPIVVDRFHVAKLYRQSIAKLRSQELKRLRKELTKEAYQSLHPGIKILISKQEHYNKKETAQRKIEQWAKKVEESSVTYLDTFIKILLTIQTILVTILSDVKRVVLLRELII
jgi:transposase